MQQKINTLRHLHLFYRQYQAELKLLLANSMTHLGVTNYFSANKDKYGADVVQRELANVRTRLRVEQRAVLNNMRQLRGGQLLVQGTSSVSKSKVLVAITQYHYQLRAPTQQPAALLVLSPLNSQLNSLAARINKALKKDYIKLSSRGGSSPKYPVVVRQHMRKTEAKVVKSNATASREKVLKEKRPPYVNKPEDEDAVTTQYNNATTSVLLNINTTLLLRQAYRKNAKTGFNKQLRLKDLSKGT